MSMLRRGATTSPKQNQLRMFFVVAAERLGVSVSDSVIIGDSVWDLLAAGRKNGLGVGLLSGGYGPQELEGAGAFRVYQDPADLLAHIEDLGIPGK